MGDDEDSGKLVGVKAGPVELELGAGLPKALAAVWPSWAVKRLAKAAFAGSIIDKVRSGQALDDAEVLYATETLGEAEAKFIRRRQIQRRALAAYQAQEAVRLPAPEAAAPNDAQGSAKATPDDWVNKFWEDAALVDDEMLQEIYARVLASEARSPGTCSLRTLGVLRYLDREAAEAFAKVAPLVFEGSWLPHELKALPRFGASHAVITSLVEAGLILAPNSNLAQTLLGAPAFFRFGRRVARIDRDESATSFPIIALTKAGKELYRVAQFELRIDYFGEVVGWLKNQCRGTAAYWAEMPSRDWEGPINQLNWCALEG